MFASAPAGPAHRDQIFVHFNPDRPSPEGRMLVAGSITPTRRAVAELLAEARARTVLLVSSLDSRDLSLEPASEVGSVLSELDRIVHYEKRWLLDDSEHQPVGSYDEWFDLMTEVRQRVLQALEQADLLDQHRVGERYHRRLGHDYRRGESILQAMQLLGQSYTPVQGRRLPRGRRLADPGIMARFP